MYIYGLREYDRWIKLFINIVRDIVFGVDSAISAPDIERNIVLRENIEIVSIST
jgi:hypothetical protein